MKSSSQIAWLLIVGICLTGLLAWADEKQSPVYTATSSSILSGSVNTSIWLNQQRQQAGLIAFQQQFYLYCATHGLISFYFELFPMGNHPPNPPGPVFPPPPPVIGTNLSGGNPGHLGIVNPPPLNSGLIVVSGHAWTQTPVNGNSGASSSSGLLLGSSAGPSSIRLNPPPGSGPPAVPHP